MNSSATMKLKYLWCSLFQTQNTLIIQKSMKHVDAASCDEPNLDYRLRRDKNNESVRKSRAKNRIRLEECAQHVEQLRQENSQLNRTLGGLQNELVTLKGLFQHCFSFNLNSLAIKPNDIPTSTLYKMIMKQDVPQVTHQQQQQQQTPLQHTMGSAVGSGVTLSDMDKFYIKQINSAISSVSKSDAVVSPVVVASHKTDVNNASFQSDRL